MRIKQKPLPFGFDHLEPYISRETIETHYLGHHAGYVKKFNGLVSEISENGSGLDAIEFNYNGHLLHEMYWESLGKGYAIGPKLGLLIKKSYGSIPVFIEALTAACNSHMGSGWTLLLQNSKNQLTIKNITNHNLGQVKDGNNILLVLDAWEHAYYLDYKNNKKSFFETMMHIINWEAAERRLV